MKTLEIVLRALARLAPVVPDSKSLLPAGGNIYECIPSICYAAAASGVIAWDAISESNRDSQSPSDEAIISELNRIGSLLRVGPNLAADFIQKHEASKSSIQAIQHEVERLEAKDERRLHLYFYLILQEIRQHVKNGIARPNDQAIANFNNLTEQLVDLLTQELRDQNSSFTRTMGELSEHIQKLIQKGESYQSEIQRLRHAFSVYHRQNPKDSIDRILNCLERSPLDINDFLWNKFQMTVGSVSESVWWVRARRNSTFNKSNYVINSARSSFATYSGLLLKKFLNRIEGISSNSASLVEHCDQWITNLNLKIVEDVLARERNLNHEKLRRALENTEITHDSFGFLVPLMVDIAEFVDGIPTDDSIFDHIDRDPTYLNSYMLRAIDAIDRRTEKIDLSGLKDPIDSLDSDYKRVVIGELDHLELLGIENIDPANTQYRLSCAFIMLLLADSEKEVCTEQILGTTRLIAIRGLAGSGKTTLLKWLAVSACRQNFEDVELQKLNGNIPIYVSLRDYRLHSWPKSLRSFVTTICPSIRTTEAEKWINDHAKAGSVMLLLDGLDEVSEAKQKEIWKWLKRNTASFPKLKVVICGRPNALPSQKQLQKGFKLFDIAEMSDSAVKEFINKWHIAAIEETLDERDKKTIKDQELELNELLTSRPELKKLTKSPLLCAMICLLNRYRAKDFPIHPIDVYKHCSRVLLYARDHARGIDTTDYPVINEKQRFALVEAIAYWMLDNNVLEISRANAEDIVLKTLRHLLIDVQTASPDNVLRLLIDRGAVFQSVGENELEFPHRSFLEYFAARAICDRNEIGKLIKNSIFQDWHDVIVMSSSLLVTALRTELISKLLDKEVSTDQRPKILLLAAACVEEATQLTDGGLVVRLSNELNEFFPPRTMQIARCLAMLGETIVDRLPRSKTSKSIERRASIRTLGIVGGERALLVLKEYAIAATRLDVPELVKAVDRNGRRYRELLGPLLAPRVTEGRQLEEMQLLSADSKSVKLVFSTPENISAGGVTNCDLVRIINCSGHQDLSFCQPLRSVSLVLEKCWHLRNLDQVTLMEKSLAHISLSECRLLDSCSALADMPDLKSIRITGCISLVDIRPLRYLKNCHVELTGLRRDVYVPPVFVERGWRIQFAR